VDYIQTMLLVYKARNGIAPYMLDLCMESCILALLLYESMTCVPAVTFVSIRAALPSAVHYALSNEPKMNIVRCRKPPPRVGSKQCPKISPNSPKPSMKQRWRH